MSQLMTHNKTMTSVEIAEMTGKRHDHVLRDIEKLLADVPPDLGRGFKSSTYNKGEINESINDTDSRTNYDFTRNC